MANISVNQPLRFKGEIYEQRWILDNSAAQHVYKGQPVILDLSEDTVYPRGFVDATTVAATDVFIGIALEEVTVLTTDTEVNNKVNVVTGPSIVGFLSSVFDDADVGKTVYMSDSGTLSETATANPQIGKLIRVEDGWAYVELTAPQICTGA
jgi:hypothetical protein